MKSRPKLGLERLEDRWYPALTTSVQAGTLLISGTAVNGTIHVNQDAATAGTINVLDGTTAVNATPFTGINNVRLNLTSADDNVTVDLGGQTLAGNVTANLGAGANSFNVVNGAIDGALNVSGNVSNGGNGRDHGGFDPGHGGCGHQGPNNAANSTTTDDVTTTLALVLAANASANNVNVGGAAGGTNVTIAGDVTGNLNVDALTRSSTGTGTGATLVVSGGVDGNVSFRGTNAADTFNLTGNVGGSVSANTLGGNDVVTINGPITGRLSLDTGAGNDQITVGNTVGGRTQINAGAGNDALTLKSTANLLGRATVSLGTGTDTATLDNAALFANLFINGGTGADAFTGTQRTGLTLASF